MGTLVHARIQPSDNTILQPEFGYTLGWDLVTVHRADGELIGRVVSLCPDRALVVLDGPTIWAETERWVLFFPSASGLPPISTTVMSRPAPTAAGDWVALLRVRGLPLVGARRMLQWLHERVRTGEALPPETSQRDVEHITDPRRIGRVLRMLCSSRSPAVVVGSGGRRLAQPVRASVEPPGSLLVRWGGGAELRPPLRVAVVGYDSVYELVWPDLATPPQATEEILRRRHRRFRRQPVPARVQVSFEHPLAAGERVVRRVHDVSVSGFSFVADTVEDVLFPGLRLEVEIGWKGGRPWRFAAIVRHCTEHGEHEVCGVELLHHDASQRTAWCREVEGLLNPRTERWPDAESLWGLYEDSGYFGLSGRTPESFEPLRRAFSSKGVSSARDSGVLLHIGARGPHRLECAMSQVEAWSGTWLLFQVARRPQERPLLAAGDDLFRATYVHAFESVASDPSARYLVAYIQDDARTPRWYQLAFGERLARWGRASVTPFRALEVQATDLARRHVSSTVDLARPDERTLAQAWLRSHRSPHYVAATGLDGEHLELGSVEERWHAAGLDRAREVWVARDEAGNAEAVLIADRAEPGVHLFGLLDVARFVPLVDGARRHLVDLLGAAARWHADAGRRRFVYFEEDPSAALPPIEGVDDLGLAHTVVIPVEHAAEFLEHVHELTSAALTRGPCTTSATPTSGG